MMCSVVMAAGAEDGRLWSLEPVGEVRLPEVRDVSWVATGVDRFVLAGIEEAGLEPAAGAERRVLVRRAFLDLHGLPPTEAEVEAFLGDHEAGAWGRLVERLLASPRYGERWGRHWLDVARYADSNGMDEDIAHPQAWRYRDWVIAAFNADMPYDQFVVEQVAGDLLGGETLEERRKRTTGVGFLSVGPKMLACDDPDKMRRDIVDEQIDTVGRAFMGMTFGCARCHDHKFDPISAEDYYGLAGIFMSTKTLTKYSVVAEFHQHDLSAPGDKERRRRIAELEKELKGEGGEKEGKQRIEGEIAVLKEGLGEKYEVMAVTEDAVADVAVHLRGDYLTLGEVVPRRMPVGLAGPGQAAMPDGESGRVELGRWISSGENPLTARVMANRVWRWHFGRGIVPTPDNFGVLGEPPTHPELLDYLARVLVDSGWSVKDLHREIMASATYRQSAMADAEVKERDPENALYAWWKPRRMESEVVRDSILAVSGRLDLVEGGSMLEVRSNAYVDRGKLGEHAKSLRRTVYLPVLRSSGYEGQKAFDFPDPAMITGDRKASTVAPQALYLMNSELVHASASALADAVEGETDAERVGWLVRRVLGRAASDGEIARGLGFVEGYGDGAWDGFARVLFASNEFLYIE